MATLIANADGNLTGASTFAGAETGALALNLVRNSTSSLASAASVTSATFTVTNAKVIDGALLWLQTSGTNGTGTFKVDLQKGGVSQAAVTVNKSDLPDSTNTIPVPVFFKFTSTATGDGGSNWTLVLTTTSGTGAATITYNINASGSTNLTRALRTTTAATPAAADDLYVVGELTGAATHNSRAVTMDSTATTAYGNGAVNSTTVSGGCIQVSNYGTLTYGTSASTNYVLRVNGDVIVYQFGTLSVGATGAEIPRTSTAVLEFQQASATGDFGLRGMNNSTVNIAGLSRTSGKNIVQCKLTADATSANVLTSGPSALNVTNATSGGLDAGGTSLFASTATDTTTNANHTLAWSGPSITNTTQSFQVWLARGTGTNNRFVRLEVGNNSVLASVTKGFFADVDLQAGTIGTCTAVGTGTATSSSIAVVGGGFVCTIIGKVDASAATPSVFIAICSAAGTTSFAGANNQALLYEDVQLVTATLGDTTYNVDTDTGWLSGDQVCIATTTRTVADCENSVLSANAGASSLVSHLYPFGYGGPTASVAGTHSGTSPTQAEIGLLTRNVKIRSTSSTLLAYVYLQNLATVTCSWAEFYYLGSSFTATKRGIEIDGGASSANAKSFTFCSNHDAGGYGFLISTNAGPFLNTTLSNNVLWNIGSQGIFLGASNGGNADWTISGNLIMKVAGSIFTTYDLSGTISNNTLAGGSVRGFELDAPTTANITIGTFDGNTVHSCGFYGLNTVMTNIIGTMSNLTIWRCNIDGIFISSGSTSTTDLIFSSINIFGNPSGVVIQAGDAFNLKGTNFIGGDTSFSCSSAITFSSLATLYRLDIAGLDTTGGTSIYVPPTSNDLLLSALNTNITFEGTMNNCKLGAPTQISSKSVWAKTAYIGMEKYGQVAGAHRCELTYGQLKTDTTFFNTASPSMRMTPSNASNKLESAPKYKGILVAVTSGTTVAIGVNVRKSAVGDGAAYNGNQPRLIQRANPALGQNSDVVIATYSAGTGAWNLISGTSSSATDDGCWEFIVDCDGTAGWCNVDDWQAA